jgi:electron transport complex protein RnfB
MNASLADAIDAVLPQTQCTRCGYAACRPYAEAVARGEADINQCPPGGAEGVHRLAVLVGCEPKPLNPANGAEQPRAAALIDESRCIGCMLCIQACPTDAITGAAKRMHTVLTQYCSGCELCLPPCPVDCIEMVPLQDLAARGNRHATALASLRTDELAPLFRDRFDFRRSRLARDRQEREDSLARKADAKLAHLSALPEEPGLERKKAIVRAAIERARARRASAHKAKP